MLTIKIFRLALSHRYKRDPKAPGDWYNNDAHNSLDTFVLFKDGAAVLTTRCQTIANMEGLKDASGADYGARYLDSIAPGPFELVAFVPPRDFYGRIHGIANTKTLGGEVIGPNSTTPSCALRTLVHDWQKHRSTSGPGVDTRVAWSASCIVMPDAALAQLGKLLDAEGIEPGTRIAGELFEEGDA